MSFLSISQPIPLKQATQAMEDDSSDQSKKRKLDNKEAEENENGAEEQKHGNKSFQNVPNWMAELSSKLLDPIKGKKCNELFDNFKEIEKTRESISTLKHMVAESKHIKSLNMTFSFNLPESQKSFQTRGETIIKDFQKQMMRTLIEARQAVLELQDTQTLKIKDELHTELKSILNLFDEEDDQKVAQTMIKLAVKRRRHRSPHPYHTMENTTRRSQAEKIRSQSRHWKRACQNSERPATQSPWTD